MNRDHDHDSYPERVDFSQARGWIKEKWGWLTNDELLEMEGKAEKLRAKVQDHYGEDRWEDEYGMFTDEYPEYRYEEDEKSSADLHVYNRHKQGGSEGAPLNI